MISETVRGGKWSVKDHDGHSVIGIPAALVMRLWGNLHQRVIFSYIPGAKGIRRVLKITAVQHKTRESFALTHKKGSIYCGGELQHMRFHAMKVQRGLICEVEGDAIIMHAPDNLHRDESMYVKSEIPQHPTPDGLRARSQLMADKGDISCATHLALAADRIEELEARLAGTPTKPPFAALGLSDEVNGTVQIIVEGLQETKLMQRIADYAQGRERGDIDWQARLDALYKEIY